MHLEGSFQTPAAKALIWEYVINPKKIAPCLPDLQSLEILDQENFKAKVKVGVKGVKGTIDFDFRIANRALASSAMLVGKGRGVASTVEIEAKFTLADSNNGTNVAWVADVAVSGMLAALSGKIIESIATEWINQVVGNLMARLSAGNDT